jgi:hypothetical protein
VRHDLQKTIFAYLDGAGLRNAPDDAPVLPERDAPAKAEILLSAGADVNARTDGGHTALLLAADYDGAGETVEM